MSGIWMVGASDQLVSCWFWEVVMLSGAILLSSSNTEGSGYVFSVSCTDTVACFLSVLG